MDFLYKKSVEFEQYEKVGNKIKDIMRARGLAVNSLAQRLKDENVFQYRSTARKFVIDIRNGYMNFWIGEDKSRERIRNLEKLSYLFSFLNINVDDDIVEIIRKANPGFSYILKRDCDFI